MYLLHYSSVFIGIHRENLKKKFDLIKERGFDENYPEYEDIANGIKKYTFRFNAALILALVVLILGVCRFALDADPVGQRIMSEHESDRSWEDVAVQTIEISILIRSVPDLKMRFPLFHMFTNLAAIEYTAYEAYEKGEFSHRARKQATNGIEPGLIEHSYCPEPYSKYGIKVICNNISIIYERRFQEYIKKRDEAKEEVERAKLLMLEAEAEAARLKAMNGADSTFVGVY